MAVRNCDSELNDLQYVDIGFDTQVLTEVSLTYRVVLDDHAGIFGVLYLRATELDKSSERLRAARKKEDGLPSPHKGTHRGAR